VDKHSGLFIPAASDEAEKFCNLVNRSSSAYDAKKLNGSSLQQQQQQQLANGSEVSNDPHLRVVTPAKNGARTTDYVGGSSVLQQAASPRTATMQTIYDSSDKSDLSNGMYSHELVTAISQVSVSTILCHRCCQCL